MALQREQVVQTAEKYVSRGKIEPAIREYRKLLAENPNDINTLNRVGDLYAKIQRIDEAVDFFSQIGEQYSSQGFFVKAIAIYKKIIKLDPTRLDIYEQLADLYHKQNLVTEARTQYQVLADYYTKHENAASAIAIYSKMTVLEPENPSYHVKLAEIYQQQKLFEKAMNEYRIIAELMIQHGRTQDASQVYERALNIDAKNLRFIWDAVEALRAAGDDGSAARFLAVAVERNPEAQEIARELATRRAPQPEPEPEPEPEMELTVETDEPAALTVEDDASIELEIDLGDDLMAAMRAAEASVADSDEIEIDLDPLGEMVVELPTEEESASQVKPPPDLAGAPVRPAWARQETVEEPPALELELELELEDSLTLEPLEVEGLAAEPAPSAPSSYSAPAESFAEADAFVLDPLEAEVELGALPTWDAEEIAPPAAEVPTGPSREEIERDELITEAEVLAKYGLEEKAVERLEESLRARPDSLLAHSLLIRIHLDKGRHEKVFPLARRMAEISVMDGVAEPWQGVRQRLEESGYQLSGDVVVAGPHMTASPPAPVIEEPPAPPEPEMPVLEEISLDALEEISLDEPEAIPFEEPAPPPPPAPVLEAPAPAPRPTAAKRKEMDDLLRGILQDKPARKPGAATPPPRPPSPPPVAAPPPVVAAPAVAPPAPPPAPPAPAPAAKSGLFDLTSLGSMIEEEEAGIAPSSPAFPPPAASDADSLWESTKPGLSAPPPPAIEDSGVNWLDEADAAANTAKPPAQQTGPGLFDEEDDFFDLAGELVEELSKEEVFQDGVQAEQSLEEIVEGFKKGVAEHLSPTDYDTHFNLGIAYREMGLLDEAIGEFQLAAKDARYLVISSSMLGLCFQDKGLPELSVKWYRRGLEAPNLSEDDQLGLMYDLGNAYMAMGDMSSAFATFVELYGINTNYRDVVAKLEELRK